MSSTLDNKDVLIVEALVRSARAAGLSRCAGSFTSESLMHKSGYSQVKFTWEQGRHGDKGSIYIEWNASLRMDENFKP